VLEPGEPVVLMGPTGTPTETPAGETVVLVGGGLGNAVLLSIGGLLGYAAASGRLVPVGLASTNAAPSEESAPQSGESFRRYRLDPWPQLPWKSFGLACGRPRPLAVGRQEGSSSSPRVVVERNSHRLR